MSGSYGPIPNLIASENQGLSMLVPFAEAAAVTLHDTNTITLTRALWVGTGGNLKVTMANGVDITFNAVPNGTLLRLRVIRCFTTGSTASNVVALY